MEMVYLRGNASNESFTTPSLVLGIMEIIPCIMVVDGRGWKWTVYTNSSPN